MVARKLIIHASILILIAAAAHAQSTGLELTANGPLVPQLITIPGPQLAQVTPAQVEEARRQMTPQQRSSVAAELQKSGGQVTPQAIEALKGKPEFQNLTPEEIAKGKDLLQKTEKPKDQKGAETKETGKREPFPQEKTVIGEQPRSASLFDRYRLTGKYQDISTNLRPFGYDFFNEAAVTVQTERKDIPVPAAYVVGPGDEVKILLWGRVNGQHNLVIDRNGNITMPQIGPLHVAGMTFEQMSGHLIKQSEQIVGANMDITMGTLKSIPIFVLGDVRRPGSYTVGSFATLVDALIVAGGPSEIGSMRNVQLRRKDRVITTFDLYDLLIKGDKSKDSMLQAGDVVFVPVVGPIAGVAGNVKRPAIYELKNRNDLQTLFDMAGGIIPTAYTQQIQVERVQKNERQVVVDINDKNLTRAKDFHLQDGDLVKVFPVVDKDVNAVYLSGNVKRPGKYEYKAGMRLKDLVKEPTELLQETYFDYALIKRLVPPDMKTELIPVNLGKLLLQKEPSANLELKPQDNVFVFSKWLFEEKPFVLVEGEVRKPGKFDLANNMRLKDAILAAGGFTLDAFPSYAELYRTDRATRKTNLVKFDAAAALRDEQGQNPVMQDLDRIVIHSAVGYEYRKTVSVDGEVLMPGEYRYAEDMTVRDLVLAAGNVKESAYLGEAELSSQVVEDGKTAKTVHQRVDLGRALDGKAEHNLVLKPYDRLYIKPLTDWRRERFVTVAGEVKFPGKYVLKDGETLSEVIQRAGGYKDNAYLRGAVFTRTSVQQLQQRNLEEMAKRLQQELLAQTSSVSVSSSESLEAKKIELQQKQAFIDSLKSAKATGRMTVRLAHLRLLKGSQYDIQLEDGDALYIPMNNKVVNVMGAVMANSSIIYVSSAGPKDYVEMAGGYARYADTKNAYVLKVDGSARRLANGAVNWNGSKDRWEIAGFGEDVKQIEPGDTIVVPEKLERIAWLREIKDVTQILANVAVAAGAVYLFGR